MTHNGCWMHLGVHQVPGVLVVPLLPMLPMLTMVPMVPMLPMVPVVPVNMIPYDTHMIPYVP